MFNNTIFVQLLYILIAITIVQISKGAIKHTDERNWAQFLNIREQKLSLT